MPSASKTPESECDDGYVDKVICTPLDKVFFRRGCSTCMSLTTAAALISLLCLVWSSAEFVLAEQFTERFFPKKDIKYQIAYAAYVLIVTGFLIATLFLIFGICLDRYKLVSFFIWYAILFNIIYVLIHIASVVMMVVNKKKFTTKIIFRIAMSFLWSLLFWYFLILVNSYRLTIYIVYGSR